MADDHNHDDGEQPPKRPRKPRATKYANAPYEVGKGKPPTNTRFEPGNQHGRGRKKGSKNKISYSDVLDELISVAEDRAGRPIKKSYREVIYRNLALNAAKAAPWAVKLSVAADQKALERLQAEPAKDDPEAAERQRHLIAMIHDYLDLTCHLKQTEMGDFDGERFRLYGPGFPKPELKSHEQPEPWSLT